ncbi:MAG TPA: hypothetical protein DCZ95_08475 [Verrucomicrobia bacterium]|nr:MAG: hypothetical protein A2X46_12510 [Lentisphaerae bacterium GWF2_57_35]HBA84113.1 hypothetical protein [Verrucomicrobiota bacterium]
MLRRGALLGLFVGGALAFTEGCVVKRGIDFGHWAASAEKIPLIRKYNVETSRLPGASARVALLPPINHMPEPTRTQFRDILLTDLRNHVPVQIFEVDEQGPLAEYVREDNLAPTVGVFDFQEAGRLGRLLGASHVLCVRVRDFRLHPPQVLALYLAMVETSSGQVIAEFDASYDASEQQVVMAMDDYLQSRRARGYDKTNLEIMMRSPMEFHSFVCTQCSRALAETLWP